MVQPFDMFVSYSHQDEDMLRELKTHLAPLQKQGVIQLWTDREIDAGTVWDDEIRQKLEVAHIVLLLVSARFLASSWCDQEMTRALERHKSGTVCVIPIVIASCDWKDSALSRLQALPKDAKPVKAWSDRDEAWTDVAKGIRQAAEALRKRLAVTPAAAAAGGGGNPAPQMASAAPQPNRALSSAEQLRIADALRDQLRDGRVGFVHFLARANILQGNLRDEDWFELVRKVHAGGHGPFGNCRDAVARLVRVALAELPSNAVLTDLLRNLDG